jgi:drug/metabolite transporter (DMT)-like permease
MLWDGIPKRKMAELVSKVIQRTVLMFCLVYALKSVPIVMVSVITNTQPIFTAIFAYIFLKEKITRVETIALLTSFLGVYILVTNNGNSNRRKSTPEDEKLQNEFILGIVTLVCAPILMALGSIQTRRMKDLHEYTANFYAIVVGSIAFGIWVGLTEEGL